MAIEIDPNTDLAKRVRGFLRAMGVNPARVASEFTVRNTEGGVWLDVSIFADDLLDAEPVEAAIRGPVDMMNTIERAIKQAIPGADLDVSMTWPAHVVHDGPSTDRDVAIARQLAGQWTITVKPRS